MYSREAQRSLIKITSRSGDFEPNILASCQRINLLVETVRLLVQPPDPPGPKGIPIFGNEFQIPRDKQWLRFHEWSQQYGDIVGIKTMGQPVLILSSAQATFDLLETRGNIYSNRPRAVMAGELVGWNRGLGYAPYGERFKEFRRMFHQTMGPRSVQDLIPIQEKENARFLFRLLEKPRSFMEHARQSTGAIILMIAYGYSTQSENDPLVNIAEEAMVGFSKASEPGAFIVDRFPFLKYVPGWFPGADFQRIAKAMRKDLERLYNVPFEFVKSEIALGQFTPSFTSKYLTEKQDPSEDEKEFVKAAAASLYSVFCLQTPSSIASFILAMALYPGVQARGQAEIDAVVGTRRLPTFSDRNELRFVNAIVKEILRWNPAVPLGLPHQVVQNDVYRDYSIAKGTIVWANIWSILHDDKMFPEPLEFRPERFLGVLDNLERDRTTDPSILAFGFGRRICPGMHLAENSIFIAVATMLSVFDISKSKDSNGIIIEPEVDYSGFISHPKPFLCDIRPRSAETAELIRQANAQF
ncbi:cytochrome P450 [Phellopilus nigrolimitatus]|nr:cytochrome P450 [Phellopilus nigrolimitatus]